MSSPRVPPHPAKVAEPSARPPHPAKVAQPSARPPHPAKVAQPSVRPPRPATIDRRSRWPWGRPASIQRAMDVSDDDGKDEKKGEKIKDNRIRVGFWNVQRLTDG